MDRFRGGTDKKDAVGETFSCGNGDGLEEEVICQEVEQVTIETDGSEVDFFASLDDISTGQHECLKILTPNKCC